jgi:hypothetical protein
MGKINWGRVKVSEQMRGPCEEANPKDEERRIFLKIPPPPNPAWMMNPSLLPKKPPRKVSDE